MHKAFELLDILKDGRAHSGADVAERLGVSRAAVWSRITRLRRTGVDVYAVPGRGYRLPGGYEFLDAARVAGALGASARARLKPLIVSTIVDSTNQRLLEASAREDVHGRVWLAEYQTSGRGRRGDRWHAPPGSGVCLSLGWRFDAPPSSITALSLVAGVALVRAVHRSGAAHVELKWPNDLLFARRKLAGILIEMQAEFGGPCLVVVGVGINVALPNDAWRDIGRPCADLRAVCGETPSRNDVAAHLIDALTTALCEFEGAGFAAFEREWKRFDALEGRPIRLVLPGRSIAGVARGVERSGALIVEHGGRTEVFMTGHVELEPPGRCC